MRFAFDVSIEDMVRKKGDRFHNPVDFLDDVIISRLYEPGRRVYVHVEESFIFVHSDGSIDTKFIDEIEQGDIFAKADVLPPVSEYAFLELSTPEKCLEVDKDRNVKVKEGSGNQKTRLRIGRIRNGNDEVKRLKELYNFSDLDVKINGESLEKAVGFEFDRDGVRGVIAYDKRSRGNIHYFVRGRFVDKQSSGMGGVDIFLHKHGLAPNVAKTKVLTKGDFKQENERLHGVLAGVLVDYVKGFENGEQAKQTLMRNVHDKYPSAALNAVMKDKVLFADRFGDFRNDYTIDYVTEHIDVGLSASDERLYQDIMGESRQQRHKKFMEELRRKHREEMLRKQRDIKMREQNHKQTETPVANDYSALFSEVSEILGVKVERGEVYSFGDGLLKVPESALGNDALKIAMDAVPHMSTEKDKRMKLYSQIVQYSSGVNPENGFFG